MLAKAGQTDKNRVATGDRAQPLLRPHQFPSLAITLPPGALALYIRIKSQILFQRDRLNGQHITNIQRRNPHHQNIDIVRRVPTLAFAVNPVSTSYPRAWMTEVLLSCTRHNRPPESRTKS